MGENSSSDDPLNGRQQLKTIIKFHNSLHGKNGSADAVALRYLDTKSLKKICEWLASIYSVKTARNDFFVLDMKNNT